MAAEQTIRSQLKTFIIILSGGFVTMLNVSIVNVALPSMGHSLGADPAHLQWIIAGYALTFGLTMIPGGRFGDMFGRRRIFIIGLATFAVSSLACGFAPNPEFLVGVRLFQGFFAGLIAPQVTGLIQQIFRGRVRANAFGLYGMSIGVSTSIGPVLGGILVSAYPHIGWRLCFLVSAPVCVILLPFAMAKLPSPAEQPDRKNLEMDLVGMVIMGIFLLFAMMPFLHASKEVQSFASLPWYYLILAALALAAFFVWELTREKRAHSVIMPRSLRRNMPFVQGTILSMLYFAGWSGLFVVYTLYLQEGLGMEAWLAGVLQLPIAVGAGLFSSLSGRSLARFGAKTVMAGLVATVVGLSMMIAIIAWAPRDAIPGLLVAAMFITGAGSGFTISPNQSLTLAHVPTHTGGTAGGILQTGQRIGTSVGIAMSTLVFFAGLAYGQHEAGRSGIANVGNLAGNSAPHAYTLALTVAALGIIAFTLVAMVFSVWGMAVEKKWGGINAVAPTD